ncbi:MAG: alpha/beta fold hydrolase [Gammaproteobacteria bacterium]|nr:alpha/beta fold hydrolase [Gammaproteobacteria bacterium]
METKDIAGADNKFVNVNGINTHYYEAGKGEPLILIHGGGAGADAWGNWRGSIHDFAEHFHVFAIDMLGFGFTDKPDPSGFDYNQTSRVDHICAFIDHLDLTNVSLIGNSMGGMTSMGVAIENRAKVSKIVLMGSAGIHAPISDELKSIMNYDYSPAGMERIVQGLTNPDFQYDDDIVLYRHGLSIDPATTAAYNAIMGWIRDQTGLYYDEDYIRQVSQPTLVVNGKLDKVVQLDCAYKLLELIDDSTGYILPHCGHWAMIEHPQKFARVALSFLLD